MFNVLLTLKLGNVNLTVAANELGNNRFIISAPDGVYFSLDELPEDTGNELREYLSNFWDPEDKKDMDSLIEVIRMANKLGYNVKKREKATYRPVALVKCGTLGEALFYDVIRCVNLEGETGEVALIITTDDGDRRYTVIGSPEELEDAVKDVADQYKKSVIDAYNYFINSDSGFITLNTDDVLKNSFDNIGCEDCGHCKDAIGDIVAMLKVAGTAAARAAKTSAKTAKYKIDNARHEALKKELGIDDAGFDAVKEFIKNLDKDEE